MMTSKTRYEVRTAGDPVLKSVAQPIPMVTPEIRELAGKMIAAMRAFDGIGLAAPQIGESLRLVVFDVPGDEESNTPAERALLDRMPLAVVNPEILSRSRELRKQDEGCLSVPDIFAPVVRPARVLFRAMTLEGERIECECGGLLGCCIQHELDHLEGVIFTDRLSPEAAQEVAPALKKLIRYGERHKFHRVKVE